MRRAAPETGSGGLLCHFLQSPVTAIPDTDTLHYIKHNTNIASCRGTRGIGRVGERWSSRKRSRRKGDSKCFSFLPSTSRPLPDLNLFPTVYCRDLRHPGPVPTCFPSRRNVYSRHFSSGRAPSCVPVPSLLWRTIALTPQIAYVADVRILFPMGCAFFPII